MNLSLRYDYSSKYASIKVYIVSYCGEWTNNLKIDRVFDDEQKAEEYCKRSGPRYFYDIMDLE
jgi:hypothetical protein